jgi:hypothetical protein
MKPIKKFSATSTDSSSILESANLSPEALAELVQKLGYNNIDEIKKEKALLSKLEALLKEFNPKQDVSEDDAEDIEDEINDLGEPKSLEDKDGEKEEDKEVGSTSEVAEGDEEIAAPETGSEDTDEDYVDPNTLPKGVLDYVSSKYADAKITKAESDEEGFEVYLSNGLELKFDANGNFVTAEVEEDAAEDIEGDIKDLGEPKEDSEKDGEKVVTKDQEITADVPGEGDDEESGTNPVTKRRIMTFDDFVKEEEETINKNVSYQDDEEEDEDNALPVADSVETEETKEEEIEETVSRTTSSIKSFSQFVSESYLSEEADNGPELKEETPDANGIAITIAKGDGSETAAGISAETMKMGEPEEKKEEEGEELVTKDQKITKEPETSKDEPTVQGTVVVKEGKISEKEIKSDADFEEYATEILKSAHGADFDEAKAKEVIDGLKSKYKGDFGAMVGALQSSMGK